MAEKPNYLQYKGRPLVRQGNMIYYGSMAEQNVIMIQVLTTREEAGMTVADKVRIQLISTDPEAPLQERMLKTADRNGLFTALELGDVWLSRA